MHRKCEFLGPTPRLLQVHMARSSLFLPLQSYVQELFSLSAPFPHFPLIYRLVQLDEHLGRNPGCDAGLGRRAPFPVRILRSCIFTVTNPPLLAYFPIPVSWPASTSCSEWSLWSGAAIRKPTGEWLERDTGLEYFFTYSFTCLSTQSALPRFPALWSVPSST